jgi:tight adherence protein B
VSPGLLLILSFVAGVLLVVGIFSLVSDLVLKDRAAVSRRLAEEFRRNQREQIRKSPLFRDLAAASSDDFAEGQEVLTLRQRLTMMLEQSGTGMTLDRLIPISIGAGVVAGLLGALVQGIPAAVVAGLIAAAVPYLYVRQKWVSRMQKMRRQLPDAFDLMSRVIRAGQTTAQAVQAVADEFEQPLAGEFNYCAEQQNLGLSPEAAFRDLARRTGLLELKIFVLALLVQQQTGGNLAEVLDKLAGVVRERFRMQSKIKALTAEGRMQAVVLLIIPFALLGFMMLFNQKYAETIIRYPGLVVAMVVIEGIGALWIRKVVNFDF